MAVEVVDGLGGRSVEDLMFEVVVGSGGDRALAHLIDRWDLDRQPYLLGRRTPVLYSRNQSRTNIALSYIRKFKETGQLAELIYVILERRRIISAWLSTCSNWPAPLLSSWEYARCSREIGI